MDGLLTAEKIGLALVFAVPGLIILYVRGQFITNRRPSLADASLNYVALSLVYQALVFPLTQSLLAARAVTWVGVLAWALILFAGPALLGGILGVSAQLGWARALLAHFKINTSHPINAAWDWRFTACESCWVLAVLKDGTQWAGYLGPGSFMSTDPGERDLYIEQVYSIDEKQQWTAKGSGVWIAHGELQSLELWPIKGAPNV